MNIEREFDTRFKKLLSETLFNYELSCNWYSLAVRSLAHVSLLDLGLTAEELKSLYVKANELQKLNCYEAAILNNLIEGRSPSQLGLLVEDYIDIIQTIADVSKTWVSQTEEMKQGLLSQLADEQKALNKSANHLKRAN